MSDDQLYQRLRDEIRETVTLAFLTECVADLQAKIDELAVEIRALRQECEGGGQQ